MTTYTDAELSDLTDAERAALEDGGEETTAQGTDYADKPETDTASQAAVDPGDVADAAADGGAAADAPGAEAAKPATDEPGAKTQPAQIAPVLVAEAPADVEAKLADIKAKKDALEAEFDDGDITRKQYREQMDALGKDERDIERAQQEAALADKMNEQVMLTAWRTTARTYADTQGYSSNPRLFRAFDMEVQEVATSAGMENATWAEILGRAHDNMVEAGMAPATAKKADQAKPEQQKIEHKAQPPNLATVPAAAHSDTSGGKYAAIDRLRDGNDPDAYEEALMRMSEKERDLYLAS